MKKSLTKLWKVMKICAAQAMIAMVICGISVAHENYGQLLDRKVSVSLDKVPLEVALNELETAAGVRIFYSIDQLGFDEFVSIQAVDESLRLVLDELLGEHGIKYKVDEKKRAVSLKRERDLFKETETIRYEDSPDRSIRATAYAVTGSVSDRVTQLPMAGVNVIVKGTTIGTTTDSDGKYAIQADDNSVLVFSFIGYTTFETSVAGRSVIDVVMDEDVQSLNQVVINAGYWNVKDRERTGNITKIAGDELEKQPVQNPLAALQASVPGLQITQLTGVPGGNFTVRIRGQSSIGNGNDPLFIVDGVPFTSNTLSTPITSQNLLFQGTNPLNMLSPSDIESIEILKDADATAIYGSRGANGVILITTRKGHAGKTKVSLSVYSGVGEVASKLKLLNTPDYLEMRREAYANDGLTPSTSGAPDLLVWDTTRFTDWQKELIGGTAHSTDGQFAISGGTENTRYYFSTSYHKEGSVFPGNSADKRISSHLDVSNASSNGKFESFVRINYSMNDTEFINRDLTTLALTLPPNAPELYNDAGELNWGAQAWNASMPHPLQHLSTGYESNTKNLVATFGLQYSPISNLDVKLNLGYTDLQSEAIATVPISYYYPPQRTFRENGSTFSNRAFENWSVEPQVNGHFDVGVAGKVDVLVGTTFLRQLDQGSYIGGSGYANESLMKNLQAASTVQIGTVDYNEYRYNALFARVNYALRERYIINITGRRDGSSRFGPGRQYANFGAVGLAWIFSEEQFCQTLLPFLSFAKLRSSYGITGNDQISDYQYMDTYAPSRAYRGVAGLSPVRLSNADFAWETNTKYEAGLELGFLRDRLSAAFSYYRNVSSDQLVGTPLAPTAGFATVQSNFPAVVENTGWEVALSSENIDKPSFSWSTSLNFTLPENKLLEFPNLEASPQYANTLVVGEPLSIKKAYRYLGVNPSTGLYEFADTNDDGVLDDRDRETIKFIGQRCYGGLQNVFKYRGFELKVLLQFVKQSGPNYITYMTTPGGRRNSPEYVLTRWQKEGDNTDIQKYTVVGPAFFIYSDYFRNSDRSVGDASFLRLKNVYFSYTFPKGWAERIHLGSARVFMQGQNLLTISNYEGLDPETFGFALPPLRVATAGLQLEF